MLDVHAHYNSMTFSGLLNRMDEIQNNDKIEAVINVATCNDSSKEIINHAKGYSKIYTTIGVSNSNSTIFSLSELKKIYNENSKIVAIGELGLTDKASLIYESRVFSLQLQLANELGLPIIINGRGELNFIIDVLKNNPPKYGCMFESPISNIEILKQIVNSGYYVSLSAVITRYTNDDQISKIVEIIPDELLLVGSNAPFSISMNRTDERNSTLYLEDTIKFLSNIKNMCYNDIEELTSSNAKTLFKRMK